MLAAAAGRTSALLSQLAELAVAAAGRTSAKFLEALHAIRNAPRPAARTRGSVHTRKYIINTPQLSSVVS